MLTLYTFTGMLEEYMKFLILGNGAAGVTAAVKLRELDGTSAITIVSAEDVPAYAKIMLPDYIGGSMERSKLFIRDEEFYAKNNINFLKNKKVMQIDTNQSVVFFQDSSREPYDKLLAATGSNPFIPRIDGLEAVNYFTINSLKDADIIRNNAQPGKNAVIMGGGLTGIEMAFALYKLGMKVFIVEREKALLPQQLDEESSSIMEGYLEKEGITFHGGASVNSVEADNTGSMLEGEKPKSGTAVLSDGTRLDFSMLVAAIGTRPGLEYVKGSDIKTGRGILVDEYMKSSADNVYAAGDVAEAVNAASNGFVSSYIWPNAMAQGKIAAFNMTGSRQAFDGTAAARNMTQLRDMQFASMGLVRPKDDGCEILKLADRDSLVYRRVVLKGNIIVGFTLIGDVRRATEFSSLIRKGSDITDIRNDLLRP